MPRITSKPVALAAVLAVASASSQAATLLGEGFESVSALSGSGWLLANLSTPAGSTDWFQGDGVGGPFSAQAGVVKVKNAQDAGAVGVVISNNAAGLAPALGGADATITIPTVSVTQDAGATLRAAIEAAPEYGSRSQPGSVTAAPAIDDTRKAGADSLGRPLLYTPATLASGSSVSHWDTTAFPNLLMEPNINADLTTVLVPPKDLTFPLLKDLGW